MKTREREPPHSTGNRASWVLFSFLSEDCVVRSSLHLILTRDIGTAKYLSRLDSLRKSEAFLFAEQVVLLSQSSLQNNLFELKNVFMVRIKW